jgi:hypothetical protein
VKYIYCYPEPRGLSGYTDFDVHDLDCDLARHRQQFADLEGAGVEWITIEGPGGAPERAVEWVRWFGTNVIRAQ